MTTSPRRWTIEFSCPIGTLRNDVEHPVVTLTHDRDDAALRDRAYAWLDEQGKRGCIKSVREVVAS